MANPAVFAAAQRAAIAFEECLQSSSGLARAIHDLEQMGKDIYFSARNNGIGVELEDVIVTPHHLAPSDEASLRALGVIW